MMDQFEQIAHDAETLVVILGNMATSDVQFVDLQPIPAETARAYAARGLSFIGVVGMVQGVPRVALEPEVGPEHADFLAQSFTAYWQRHMRWTAQPDMNAN